MDTGRTHIQLYTSGHILETTLVNKFTYYRNKYRYTLKVNN